MRKPQHVVIKEFPCCVCGKVTSVATPTIIFVPKCLSCLAYDMATAQDSARDALLAMEAIYDEDEDKTRT